MREAERERMVSEQIAARGVIDARVLDAMCRVPRHVFVPAELQHAAYFDEALTLGPEQSISQPYIVGRMLEALQLQPADRALEVGTGSGYQAALLRELCAAVFSIERDAGLCASASATLRQHGYGDVQVRLGDGTLGWPEAAPFDAIIVAAAGPAVPEPLLRQLADGGRLLIPVGPPGMQEIVRITRHGSRLVEQAICGARFVPLIGGAEPS